MHSTIGTFLIVVRILHTELTLSWLTSHFLDQSDYAIDEKSKYDFSIKKWVNYMSCFGVIILIKDKNTQALAIERIICKRCDCWGERRLCCLFRNNAKTDTKIRLKRTQSVYPSTCLSKHMPKFI